MILFVTAGALFFFMTAWFVVSLIQKRNDVADIAWGLGFVFVAWISWYVGAQGPRAFLANSLVTVWGLRLAFHIFQRNAGKPEDARYRSWRESWGSWFILRSYLQVFLLQGVFLFFIASPIFVIAAAGPVGFSILDLLGVCIWSIGFFFETVGDSQLREFVKNPANRGKLLTTGLWRYSRHPNYFGEVTQWWGIWCMASHLPYGDIALVGPLTITILILFVSGVPLLEKKYEGRKDFLLYKRKTSVFFPLPPRSL